jgi:hypothetical protein
MEPICTARLLNAPETNIDLYQLRYGRARHKERQERLGKMIPAVFAAMIADFPGVVQSNSDRI